MILLNVRNGNFRNQFWNFKRDQIQQCPIQEPLVSKIGITFCVNVGLIRDFEKKPEKACGAKQRGALEAESLFKEGTLLTTLQQCVRV